MCVADPLGLPLVPALGTKDPWLPCSRGEPSQTAWEPLLGEAKPPEGVWAGGHPGILFAAGKASFLWVIFVSGLGLFFPVLLLGS